ncbi:hypothetical protein B0H65DRAFT_453957 [Neurospora tetraspora]|uniref:Uncharacterized protein n=1 Tax=Neurospora tetraspora TaxID=94610 RepID=A0AAE0JRJ2_9PEZI|nr:hypothetical protein B0H65DRAFT_453957 [Neurospora tetraspora]
MRSYFRSLPNNASSTDPALSPYSPLVPWSIVLWDDENRMNLRVRCLGLFVDGMGRPVSSGQRKVSGESGKESSSGSDTVKAGEAGKQPEKSAPEVGEQGERGGKEGGGSGKGKRKGKGKESGNGGGENNSSRKNERLFFRPVLIDGFPLGYTPLVYWQQDSEEVMRDQAVRVRMMTFMPRAGQGQVQTGSVMGGGRGGDGVGRGMMVPQAGEQRDQAVQEWLEVEAMSVSEWQARMKNPEW